MAYQSKFVPRDGFSIGQVFTTAFSTIAANPVAAFGISFLFGGLPMMGSNYLDHQRAAVETGSVRSALWSLAISLAILILNTVISTLAQGAFVRLVVAKKAERPVAFADAAVAALARLLPLVALGVVIAIGTIVGSLLLFVPGIILALMWMVAPQAMVAEQCGVRAALARSRALTKGARGRLFVMAVGVFAVAIGAVILGDRLATGYYGQDVFARLSTVAHGFPAGYLIARAVSDTVIMGVSAALYGAIYVELRNWKEGAPTDALADIFA
jgi:hypothetical protein